MSPWNLRFLLLSLVLLLFGQGLLTPLPEAIGKETATEKRVEEDLKKTQNIVLLGFIGVMHILGALTSIRAIMQTRTSQGAIAWALSLNTCPYLAVPAYWVLGESKFDGYHVLRHSQISDLPFASQTHDRLVKEDLLYRPTTDQQESQARLLHNLARLPLTTGNDASLLVNGDATFEAIFRGIATAKDYVLVQFYILRDDDLGKRLIACLKERVQAGVRVYVLYDELGSKELKPPFLEKLRQEGIEIYPFNTRQGRGHRFRLNFRNHRKIVVVDGRLGYVGGHNVGVEYLGQDPVLSPWRDTHVEVTGPVVLGFQVSFVEDWDWATGQILDVNWDPQRSETGNKVAIGIPTGPADQLETGTLMFLDMINSARHRIWIVSPYFVPDDDLISALQLAALRGVDVRILIPENPDHKLVYLSAFSYLEEAEKANVKIFRYKPGFLHQKVMLVDDSRATVGTANFDNRSMRLNFEITLLVHDSEFAAEVEAMLEKDFEESRPVASTDYTNQSFCFRLAVRCARLLAPAQ